jgi:hypothetical protein
MVMQFLCKTRFKGGHSNKVPGNGKSIPQSDGTKNKNPTQKVGAKSNL